LLAAFGENFAANAEPPPPHAASQKPVLSSSLDQIQNQYAADVVAARSKYTKTAVQFTAVAAEVRSEPQQLVIGFRTAQHPQPINAYFTSVDSKVAASVTKGAMVQARCDLIVEVAGKLELRSCTFR
jgi:hypothetical protein